jgi:hypothetical protein
MILKFISFMIGFSVFCFGLIVEDQMLMLTGIGLMIFNFYLRGI